MRPTEIDAQFVRESLNYDPATGIFTWRKPGKCANKRYSPGVVAGSVGNHGRLMINLAGKLRQAHRLAWMHYYGESPPEYIDHADGDQLNNAISNLRACTRAQNNWNVKRSARNTSGYKGVSYHPATGKWRARIRVYGKIVSLGLYYTKESAHRAYVGAAEHYFGEFARAA